MQEEYMRTREALGAFPVSPRTLERWIASGRLPVVRVGRVRRIRRSDLEALMSPK